MSATTVNVKNISTSATEQEVRDFFSFCGKISDLSLSKGSDGTQSAAVTFEKPTAAKTALLLDNTQLKDNLVQVSSAGSLEELSADKSGHESGSGEELSQEDKPRSRIIAEYLAQGYVISDKAVERAIALDNQHGVSTRFTNILHQFNDKYQATTKAQEFDQRYGMTTKAQSGWQSLSSYFEKALGTPTGQKLRAFYEEGNKQVMDVHTEARRLADLQGTGRATPEPVPGTDATKCNCHAEDGKCGCAPGKCACSDCPRNTGNDATTSSQSEKTALSEKPAGTT